MINELYPKIYLYRRLVQAKLFIDNHYADQIDLGNIADEAYFYGTEKAKWIALIGGNADFSNPDFVHSFFGKMTKEQIGYMAHKHADHHLRQFNS